MAQLFPRAFNTLSRVTVVGALLTVGGLIFLLFWLQESPWVTQQDISKTQQVPFSHEHHVRGLGIECLYCHTSVEDSAFAGIPPTSTCINCHKEIWKNAPMLEPVRASVREGEPLSWTRVHDLPDYVYFNHSIHVARGVGCKSCHGEVDGMPLMRQHAPLNMQWCVDCHRDPSMHLRDTSDPNAVFDMTWEPPANQKAFAASQVQAHGIQSPQACSYCHR